MSKYQWITAQSERYADAVEPGVRTYRVCSRQGGRYDDLRVIVEYVSAPSADGTRRLWRSQGEVINLIPSYIPLSTRLRTGTAHNRDVEAQAT
tara:strand:+ start:200 stop:478 length:279 start_codon:yes stop_codon:yes gene_type:complete